MYLRHLVLFNNAWNGAERWKEGESKIRERERMKQKSRKKRGEMGEMDTVVDHLRNLSCHTFLGVLYTGADTQTSWQTECLWESAVSPVIPTCVSVQKHPNPPFKNSCKLSVISSGHLYTISAAQHSAKHSNHTNSETYSHKCQPISLNTITYRRFNIQVPPPPDSFKAWSCFWNTHTHTHASLFFSSFFLLSISFTHSKAVQAYGTI